MKVYVTKYALTHGIIETQGTRDPNDPNIVRIKRGKGLRELSSLDWHPNLKSARARAEEMRAIKLLSLNRQAERIDAIKF